MMRRLIFPKKLVEGVIVSRPNRFIMNVRLRGKILPCHCPSTGHIGSLKFENVPCLLSRRNGEKRKTKYTVEAISLDSVNKRRKSWIGINQSEANDYISFFIRTGQLSRLTGRVRDLKREVRIRNSRIDFLVNGNHYIEVKTPLTSLPSDREESRAPRAPSYFNRLIRHFGAISRSSGKGGKATIVLCYLYNAKLFQVPDSGPSRVLRAARGAARKGVGHWQANLKIDATGVGLLGYFPLGLF